MLANLKKELITKFDTKIMIHLVYDALNELMSTTQILRYMKEKKQKRVQLQQDGKSFLVPQFEREQIAPLWETSWTTKREYWETDKWLTNDWYVVLTILARRA